MRVWLEQREWLLCSAASAGGVIAKLYTAGVVYFVINGAPTFNGTALTGQTGSYWLEWDIEFRKPTDNQVARVEAAIASDVQITSIASITSGNPLQFTISSATAGGAVYGAEQVLNAYPTADLAASSGDTFLEGVPMYLGANLTTTGQYYVYNSLFDAINATTAHRVLATATTAAVSVPLATLFPIRQLTP